MARQRSPPTEEYTAAIASTSGIPRLLYKAKRDTPPRMFHEAGGGSGAVGMYMRGWAFTAAIPGRTPSVEARSPIAIRPSPLSSPQSGGHELAWLSQEPRMGGDGIEPPTPCV